MSDLNAASRELSQRRSALLNEKREIEGKLLTIKNLVRSSAKMAPEKYKTCCDSQKKHLQRIIAIESESSKIKSQLREIADAQWAERGGHAAKTLSGGRLDKSAVEALVSLREEYQQFSADAKHINSMRIMASEFVLKLNPIIKKAVGSE